MQRTEHEFDTEAEADAFVAEVQFVNDSAISVERVFGREDKIVVVTADSDYEAEEDDCNDGDDLCDRCMRSGVQVSQVDESGNTLCAECAGGEFDYETREECLLNQDHGEDCDDDGFCNRCGHR